MYFGFIFNYAFAWLAVVIGILLLSKYILRKLVQKSQGKNHQRLSEVNKALKIPHIFLGLILIIVGFIHGMYSSVEVYSLNIGTINWLVTILFGLTWMFKHHLKIKWSQLHRILAVIFVLTIILHIEDVGINTFRILSEMNDKTTYEAVLDNTLISQEKDVIEVQEQPKEKENFNNNNKNNGLDAVIDNSVLPFYFSFEGLELIDGTYIAESTGYSPGLKVSVTIEKNILKRIKILAHYEVGSKYYKEAMLVIPAAILDQQTLDVDAITGSSLTSVGIIKAVRNAVLQSLAES